MEKIDKISDILADLVNMAIKLEDQALKKTEVDDLSAREMRTIDAIGIRSSKTMSQVAKYLNLTMGTLTTSVGKLVRKGYVERFRIPEDRRVVKVKLTEKGIRALRSENDFRNSVVRNALNEMAPEEVEIFINGMENISQFVAMSQYRPVRKREEYCLAPVTIGGKTLEIPLVQGGMGIGVSMGTLAGTVASMGGLGIVSAVDPGYDEPDFEEHMKQANARALTREIRKAKDIAGDKGLIGANIPATWGDYKDAVRVAVEAGVDVIVSGGLPMSLPAACEGKDVALVPIISSARAAALIKRNWKKKYNRKPDAFIFESAKGAGPLGYKESQLESVRDDFYRNLLELREEIGELPMIVGGGMMERADAVRAYAYGADGIMLGSRFLTVDECDAPQSFKDAYLNLRENDVTIIKSPQGLPTRVIDNACARRLLSDPEHVLTLSEERDALIRAVRGDREQGLFFCGSETYRMKHSSSVAEIFREFTV